MKKQKKKSLKVFSKFISICFLFSFLILFSSNLVSAGFGYDSDSTLLRIGEFRQGEAIDLIQTCSNCTFNNITKIKTPDGILLNINQQMTKDGTFYNWTLTNYTHQIGEFQVSGVGDLNGNNEVWNYYFEIKGGNLGFFIIVFVLFYGLTFYGIKIENPWVSLFGCFGLLMLGIFTSFNGIDVYKNDLTLGFSYITLAIGLGIGFEALMNITYK